MNEEDKDEFIGTDGQKKKWSFFPKGLDGWVTLMIILLTVYLAWAYNRDVTALQNEISRLVDYVQFNCT